MKLHFFLFVVVILFYFVLFFSFCCCCDREGDVFGLILVVFFHRMLRIDFAVDTWK